MGKSKIEYIMDIYSNMLATVLPSVKCRNEEDYIMINKLKEVKPYQICFILNTYGKDEIIRMYEEEYKLGEVITDKIMKEYVRDTIGDMIEIWEL